MCSKNAMEMPENEDIRGKTGSVDCYSIGQIFRHLPWNLTFP
jgi:hypothetical protein